MNSRSATYVNTLVYMDEPQVITLRSHRTRIVAVAIPSPQGEARFLAASVTRVSWLDYMEGYVDLRYLFTFAEKRLLYTFDLMKIKNNKIKMMQIESASEEMLPKPHFFSKDHTEEDEEETAAAEDKQTLYVDGEWDLPDFGSFYGKFSDVYYFISSANDIGDDLLSSDFKARLADAFRDKAFRGGFSYVNLYWALSINRPRSQRLNMDEISYASPGYVSILGDEAVFGEVKDSINRFLANRNVLRAAYDKLYDYLSKGGLLTLAPDRFAKDTRQARYIYGRAKRLSDMLEIPNLEIIFDLVSRNELVFAKVVMSYQRRLEEASRFFAQGRMAYEKN